MSIGHGKQEIPNRLPLLDLLKEKYNIHQMKPLQDFLFFGVQHLQGSLVPLVHAISEAGVPYSRIFLVGKAYSTHPWVVEYLQNLGCIIAKNHCMTSPANPYEEELRLEIYRMLAIVTAELNALKGMKVLLVDEGGKAIRILHEHFADYVDYFRCVEQTTRGIREIGTFELRCPVINVARSQAKRELEGPLIARAMVENMETQLESWDVIFHLVSKKVLVLGYGVVGGQVAKELMRRGYGVSIYESNNELIGNIPYKDIRVLKRIAPYLSEFDIVIGCTGTTSLSQEDLIYLKSQALLVNGASSDIEFAAWELRKDAEIVYSRMKLEMPQLLIRPWLNLYRVSKQGKIFYLANGGFPIDFCGQVDPINPIDFQVTRSLIYLAILQVVSLSEKGIIPLDEEGQKLLSNSYALQVRNE